uniref:Uncharacterized protein n=1 Tax=Rhodosorus marinus TaxID=101924 RepID=A0A7S0BUB4_9RHOD|mmetsp:Transcript_912/g.1388  ORF Transcript_912/g.1388 Transcript_912/m.1388 type:complete len:584 (+) Transcript_912:349-2100(+)
MEWEWPEEDKQLLQQLQKRRISDPSGNIARQDGSGVDLDFVSPGEYEEAFKRDMLPSTALSHALRRIKAKTAGVAVPKLFRQREDASSKYVGEKVAGKSRVTVQDLNDRSTDEPPPDREESPQDAIALREEVAQDHNGRDERGPDYYKPVNQRTPVMQWSVSRRGGLKKKQSQAGLALQQVLEEVPSTPAEEALGEEADRMPEISMANLPGPTYSSSPENSPPVLKVKNVRGGSLAKQLSIASDSSENPENSASSRGQTNRDKPRAMNGRGAKEQQPQRTKLSRGRRAREVASKVSTPVLSKLDLAPSSVAKQELPEGDVSQLAKLFDTQVNPPIDVSPNPVETLEREMDAVVVQTLPGGDISDSSGAKSNQAADDTRRRGIMRVRPRRGGRGKDLLDQNGVIAVDLSNLSKEELIDRLEFMWRTLMETEAKCERLERESELQIDRSKALSNVTSEVQRVERIQELKYQKIEADLHENFRIVGLLESRLEEMLVKHTHLNRRSFASRFLWGTLDILTNGTKTSFTLLRDRAAAKFEPGLMLTPRALAKAPVFTLCSFSRRFHSEISGCQAIQLSSGRHSGGTK